jgi:hypothetical protein
MSYLFRFAATQFFHQNQLNLNFSMSRVRYPNPFPNFLAITVFVVALNGCFFVCNILFNTHNIFYTFLSNYFIKNLV